MSPRGGRVNDHRHWFTLGVLTLLVIPAQVQVLPHLLPEAWMPNLGIVLVFFFGLRYGEGAGVVAGLLLGLLFDRFTAGQVGHHIFILPCIGVGAALFWRLMSTRDLSAQLIMLALFALCGELAAAVLAHLTDAVLLDGWAVIHILLPGLIADVLFGAVLLAPLGLSRRRRGTP